MWFSGSVDFTFIQSSILILAFLCTTWINVQCVWMHSSVKAICNICFNCSFVTSFLKKIVISSNRKLESHSKLQSEQYWLKSSVVWMEGKKGNEYEDMKERWWLTPDLKRLRFYCPCGSLFHNVTFLEKMLWNFLL